VLLATAVVNSSGTVRVVIPAAAPAGEHRIAVLAVDGTLIGWDDVTVADSTSARLASTGVDLAQPLGAALLLLTAGAAVLALRQRGASRV
jgi:hypothetical protein